MNRPPHHPPPLHAAVVQQKYDTHNVWNFENQWNSKLFGCKPMGRCCFACFCCCCMGCQLAKYMGESSIIGCCPGSLQYLRTKLRTARRIEGDCCGDVCATTCCGACVATQMANELEGQGLWDIQKNRKTHPRNHQPYNQHNGGDY